MVWHEFGDGCGLAFAEQDARIDAAIERAGQPVP
jgi:hypothetical protein